ncbi:unnamed protein product, partial [Adineta steineri]
YKSSSEIPVSRDPYKHNGDISVSKAARLSNELVELGLRYADESLTNLKQSFANIRNSVELIKNTRQMIQQSVKKTTSKQDVPSNSSNNVVIVHRLKSTKNNTQQIDSNHKEKASLTHDCNANSTDSPTESEENDDNDNINVFPYQQQNDRSKPFIKQQMNSITVTKISRVKNSAVPSVSC